MQLSPLQQVIERFGDPEETDRIAARKEAKEGLIKAVRGLVKKGDLLEDDFSDRGIERVSNGKLLKLLQLAEAVQEKFGSRGALVEAALELEGRAKDEGYRRRLDSFRLPRLHDHYKAALKRSR